MKYSGLLTIVAVFCLFGFKTSAQAEDEKLDLPGDNLNLYSALKLFQESATLEIFEKNLNDEKSNINNLDLNGDDKIDYIKVVDNPDGNVHNITLKIAVSETEDQDVAVFLVNKESDGKVQIQVIGDEDIYGKDYIIEPDFETSADGAGTPNPGYAGNPNSTNEQPEIIQNTTTLEISMWPVVQFIYVPNYVAWRSPWRWAYYPDYWRPWQPFYWHYYYGYHYHWNYYYNSHYRRWHNYRVPGWRERYYGSPFRSQSVFVQTRYSRGDYRKTYARPELAKQGAAVFKRDFPKAPTAHDRLPSFDNAGRPVITRPAIAKPVTRPITNPGVTKPVIERPLVTKPGLERPVTRPITERPVVTKPATRPMVTTPVTPNPPSTRPVTRPVTRPTVTRPEVPRPVARPAPRPVNNRPLNPRPAAARPLERPAVKQ